MRNSITTLLFILATCLAAFAQYGGIDATFGLQGMVKRNIVSNTTTGQERAVAGVVQPDGKLVVVATVTSIPGVVMRLNADGTRDITFDGDGIASVYITPTCVALQSDGKIVVGGFLTSDFAVLRFNADGTPDYTFGTNGLVTTDWNGGVENIRGIAIQPDGKIVAAGEILGADATFDFGIARYNTNGSLDNTFGTSGKVPFSFGTNVYDYCYAVALQTDGKIVAVGNTFLSGSNADCAIARLTTSGVLDATFGSGGKTTTSMSSPYSEEFYAVAIQSDGKIVCAGDLWGVSFNDQVIARYTASGALDATFNGTGKITTSLSTYNDQAKGVAIQPDGKIVVAGLLFNASYGDSYTARYNTNGTLDATYNGTGIKQVSYGTQNDQFNAVVLQGGQIVGIGTASTATSSDDYLLARYNTNGSNDVTFNSTGQLISGIGGSTDLIYGLTIQPDGKLVAAGYAKNGANSDFALVRYNTDGSPDLTFNSTGQVVTPIGTGAGGATAVVVQPDGKTVAAGYSAVGASNVFTLVRYNPDGTLDNTFSGDGIATAVVGTGNAAIRAIAIQTDGKIVAAGFASNGSNNDFALARFNTDGSLDASFDADGLVTTAPGTLDDIAYGMAIQPDGKIVAAGYAYNGSNYDFAVVRYNTNGSLDNTFGSSGKVMTPIGAAFDQATGLVLQPDGKIVVGGYANNGTNLDFAVVRYNTNGSLDNTFGSSGKLLTPIGAYDDYAFAIDLQSDGKIVQAGYAYNGVVNNTAIVRYNSNGTLDNTFGSSGKSGLPFYTTAASQAQAVKVVGSRIYVAGNIISEAGNDFAITAVQSGLTSLPLTLLSFAGNLVNDEAHLQWETTGEINTLEFVIERSVDGLQYVTIGTVPTANTGGSHAYTFVDHNLPAGRLYYRLKQKDQDGHFTYSSVVMLSFRIKESIAKLFPNPVTSNASLEISATAQEMITYRIIGINGAIMRSATAVLLPGNNSININTMALKSGTYTLDINRGKTSQQIRFMKR